MADSDPRDILRQYYGDADPSAAGNAMRAAGSPRNALVEALLGARNAIPENTEHSLSLLNMLRGGLGSVAGWMDWKNRLSPDAYAPQDILAPAGGMAFGSAPMGAIGANALRRSPDLPAIWREAHPRTSVEGRTVGEHPRGAATAYGDDVFRSPHIHGGEYDEAVAKLGAPAIEKLARDGRLVDGFMTSTGRFLDRQEASGLADKVIAPMPKKTYPGDINRLETNQLQDRIVRAWKEAKAAGDETAAADFARQYQDITARIDADNATAYNRQFRLDEFIR